MSTSIFKLRPIRSDKVRYKALVAVAAIKSEIVELSAAQRAALSKGLPRISAAPQMLQGEAA